MHRVTTQAVDAIPGSAFGETSRAHHALVFISGQSRRAVLPKAICKRIVADLRLAADGPIKAGEIIAGIERIALTQNLTDAIHRFRNSLAVAVTAYHHRSFGRKLPRIYYLFAPVGERAPNSPSERGRRVFRVSGGRSVTGAAGNPKLGYFGVKLPPREIVVRLSFHVVTKNTVGIPLRLMFEKVCAVGIEERAVQTHPTPVHEIVS